MFNLINYPGICDEALVKMFASQPNTYIKVGGGVYVPPLTPSARNTLENALVNSYDRKKDKAKTNILIHTCDVCNNWRLKHVGAKYMSAFHSGWYRMLTPDKMNVDINSSVFEFMGKFLKEKAQKFLAIEDVDAADIVAQFTEQYGKLTTMAKIDENHIFIDANLAISHETAVPVYVKTKISEAISVLVQK